MIEEINWNAQVIVYYVAHLTDSFLFCFPSLPFLFGTCICMHSQSVTCFQRPACLAAALAAALLQC